jgi:hypothetical protein
MSIKDKRVDRWRGSKQPARINEVIAVLNKYFPDNWCWGGKGSHIVVSHSALVGEREYGQKGQFTVCVRRGKEVVRSSFMEIIEALELLEHKGLM